MDITIIEVKPENTADNPISCFISPKREGFRIKDEWYKKRYKEGLRIKQIQAQKPGKINAFIEYVPGENAWRAVKAKGFLFIHCLWVYPNVMKNQGLASVLIQDCLSEAKKMGCHGAAVVTSQGSFMAGKEVFIKNGFVSVAQSEPSFELLVYEFGNGHAEQPQFMDWSKNLQKFKGWHIVFSGQCPWAALSVPELQETARQKGIDLQITELKTAKQAQKAPSLYAVFNLIHDSKLLADHYISNRRFENILKKEL